MRPLFLVIALAALACAGAPAPPPAAAPDPVIPSVRRPQHPDAPFQAADDDRSAAVRARFAPGEQSAHPVFAGPFGPADDCAVAPVFSGPRQEIGVVVVCGDEVFRTGALYPWAGDAVPAILFEDVDGDGFAELIVVATWISGMGPDGVIPFPANAIVGWDGARLTRLAAQEGKIEKLGTAREIRAALALR